jgi:hypothetical protein
MSGGWSHLMLMMNLLFFLHNDMLIDSAGVSDFKVGSRRNGRGSDGVEIQP